MSGFVAQSEVQRVDLIGTVRESRVDNFSDKVQVVDDNRHGICRLITVKDSLAVVRVAITWREVVIARRNIFALNAERDD